MRLLCMAGPVAMTPGRVPCPLCSAPVHPIAGRCRHCRADLTRIPRPAPPPTPSARGGRAALIAMAVVVAAAALAVPIWIA